jgi:hypothetical protein
MNTIFKNKEIVGYTDRPTPKITFNQGDSLIIADGSNLELYEHDWKGKEFVFHSHNENLNGLINVMDYDSNEDDNGCYSLYAYRFVKLNKI